MTQAALFHTCPTFTGGLGAPNALLALLGALGGDPIPSGRRGGPTANRPDPLGRANRGWGGFPLLSLSDSPSVSKNSTTANLAS